MREKRKTRGNPVKRNKKPKNEKRKGGKKGKSEKPIKRKCKKEK